MTRTHLQAILIGVLGLFSTLLQAKVVVEAAQHKTMGRILIVEVSEDIAPGDHEVLLRGITSNPGKFSKKILMLDCIGGSVPEAMRMGRLLRESGFDTLVPAKGICQGSCIYLLAAGHNRTVRGHVGLHRPYYPQGDSALARLAGGAGYNPADYFREMNVSASLFDEMNSIDPKQMRVLSQQDLARYRLN